jgi:hypothetical protein
MHMASLATDGFCRTAMPLLKRNVLDADIAVLVVVPIHKCGNPLAGLLFVAQWQSGVSMPEINGAKQRFRLGIVVAHPRPGERPEYPQFL